MKEFYPEFRNFQMLSSLIKKYINYFFVFAQHLLIEASWLDVHATRNQLIFLKKHKKLFWPNLCILSFSKWNHFFSSAALATVWHLIVYPPETFSWGLLHLSTFSKRIPVAFFFMVQLSMV